jgi:tetratricopeptide (TPR) repeat protein
VKQSPGYEKAHQMTRTFVPAIVLALCTCATAFAQGSPDLAADAFTISAADLQSLSATIPVDKQFPAQILYEEGNYKIAADGTLLFTHRMVYRVDSDAAVKGWAEVSAQWDPWYEKAAQIHARVLQPNGTFVELDQKTITDAPVKAEDDVTFSSAHVRRAPLPGMAIGSIVEEQEITEEKVPYFSAGALYRFGFQDNVPAARIRMVVDLPSSMPFKELVHDLPNLAIDRQNANGQRHIVYEQRNIQAAHSYDIQLATDQQLRPTVEFATGASWGSIAKAFSAMSDPQTVIADAETILPNPLPTERDARIRAIVKELHHDVRYTGVEFGAARLTPMRPSEVIQRHYGDCKDKATLLVAMLRAAGIKANLALLDVGPGPDVSTALPGISLFDHAIVYVPADGPHTQPLWIDATAETFAVGSLPYEDEGRNALIVSPETTALTQIPAPKPEDSVLIETRTFKLAELGPSQVEEQSDTHGSIDATYRAEFGGPETPRIHENLENYVKNTYLAKSLTKFTHGDATDFEHPFLLTLAADKSTRGNSSLVDAVAVVFPNNTINALAPWFSQQPPNEGPDESADVKSELALERQARPSTFTLRPYIYEQRTRILIPDGFLVRPLPANKTTQLGPATLTETYLNTEPGVVEVRFRFNTNVSTLTADQAIAMRTAVLELNKRDYVGIFFDQAGARELTAGHIREALAIDRKLIAARPDDALHHLQLARALLDAGIGTEAQAEALRATQLDPKLSAAFAQYGWTLEHNALGERFGKGFDRQASIAAYTHAIELDPDDNDPRFDLAILKEFNARGERYAPDADLAGAIHDYQALLDLNKNKGEQVLSPYRENMMYAMLYSRHFTELDALNATLPSSNSHRQLAIASVTAQHGAPAGIAEAERGNVAQTERNQNLLVAGNLLANLGLYPEAADVMTAGMQAANDAASEARRVELYKSLKKVSLTPLPATDPARPVQIATIGLMSGTLTRSQAIDITSKHAYSSQQALERDVDKALANVGFLAKVADRSGMAPSVMLDLIAGNMTFTSKGDDKLGYAVTSTMPGSTPDHTYVVKEDGAYRVVAGDKYRPDDNTPLATEILYALDHNNAAEAKAMLDWKRDLTHKEGGDDAFGGPLLPRFWTIDSSKPGADSPAAMRLAAISLLAGSMDVKPYLAEISAARDKANGLAQTDLDLLLAVSAIYAEQPAIGMPPAQRLLDQEPDSLTALSLIGQGYSLQHDPKSWQAMLAPRLARKPDDRDLLTQQVLAYELAKDWKSAKSTEQKVLDSGKANAADYNGYAWLGLFHNDFGDDITKAAQESAQLSKNSDFPELHTLACIYAAQGKTTEARKVLDEAMYANNQVEPNSAVWYALGLIYEQYGANSAAVDAYKKVQAHENDDHTFIEPTDTYVLAQSRLTALSH